MRLYRAVSTDPEAQPRAHPASSIYGKVIEEACGYTNLVVIWLERVSRWTTNSN
jgi:hypothetical protein